MLGLKGSSTLGGVKWTADLREVSSDFKGVQSNCNPLVSYSSMIKYGLGFAGLPFQCFMSDKLVSQNNRRYTYAISVTMIFSGPACHFSSDFG